MRPSPISRRSSSARPAYAGLRSNSPARVASRGAAMDPVMQSTFSQLALDDEANRDHAGWRDHDDRRATDRAERPRPDRAAARRPAGPQARPALRRPRPLRLLDRVDGPVAPRAGAVGRA